MNHFPIFLNVEGRRIVVAGGGDAAIAKLRLLVKTTAHLTVVAQSPSAEIERLAYSGKLCLIRRAFAPGDALCAALVYGATEDAAEDARISAIARAEGALVNIVDDLAGSQFITPAIVDRDPVVVAIGTEGAAPMLARAIRADVESRLSPRLGILARVAKTFRPAAEALPIGARRRAFWADYYATNGPRAVLNGEAALTPALQSLLADHLAARPQPGHVDFVGAGPGDPDLLTLKSRKALDKADVVIHDRLISPEILELARREALIIDAGKEGFGPSTAQSDINAMLVHHAQNGRHVVRLKSGDAGIFGRLDEEIEALAAHAISFAILPGITAAAAAAASIGQSLTKRGRNASVRLITGHDIAGFADHDWKALARPGEVAAIYMAKRAARFLQGRLMMHGAAPGTPVTIVENASRPTQTITATTLRTLPEATAGITGPAILLYGLAPRAAIAALPTLKEAVK